MIVEINAISPELSDRPQNNCTRYIGSILHINATTPSTSSIILVTSCFQCCFYARPALARAANVRNRLIDKRLLIADQSTEDKTFFRYFTVPVPSFI